MPHAYVVYRGPQTSDSTFNLSRQLLAPGVAQVDLVLSETARGLRSKDADLEVG